MKHLTVTLFIILDLLIFVLFAGQINTKSIGGGGDTFFGRYNIEYKYGFPTPWYSRYYQVNDKTLLQKYEKSQKAGTCRLFDYSCNRVPTPAASEVVYVDRSWAVLGTQAILAAMTSGFITGVYVAIRTVYAHTRH